MITVFRVLNPKRGTSTAFVRSVIIGLLENRTVITNRDVLKGPLSDCRLVTVTPCGRFNAVRVRGKAAQLRKYLEKDLRDD